MALVKTSIILNKSSTENGWYYPSSEMSVGFSDYFCQSSTEITGSGHFIRLNSAGMKMLYPTANARPSKIISSQICAEYVVGDATTITLQLDGVAIHSEVFGTATLEERALDNISDAAITSSTMSSEIKWVFAGGQCNCSKLYIRMLFNQYNAYAVISDSSKEGIKNVSVSKSTFYDGEAVTYSAVVSDSAVWRGWYSDSGCKNLVSTELNYTVSPTSSLYLYAKADVRSTALLLGQSGDSRPQMCEQIDNLRAIPTKAQYVGSTDGPPAVYLSWKWPTSYEDDSCEAVVFYRKEGSIPTKLGDGSRVPLGSEVKKEGILPYNHEKYTGSLVDSTFGYKTSVSENVGKTYYYRAFTRSADDTYQISQRAVSVTLEDSAKLGNLPVGSLVRFSISNSSKNFIIVHQGIPDTIRYGDDCFGTWLLMQDIYTNRAWDSSGGWDYTTSSINTYLNGTFYNYFTSSVRNIIKQVNIPVDNTYNPFSGATLYTTLSTKVFLLDRAEIEATRNSDTERGAVLEYFDRSSESIANSRRIANYNGSAAAWYTRWGIEGISESQPVYIVYVSDTGDIYSNLNSTDSKGIRPAIILPSDTKVNVSTTNSDGSYNLIL